MIRFRKLGILRSIIPPVLCINVQLWIIQNPRRNLAKGMLAWARKPKEPGEWKHKKPQGQQYVNMVLPFQEVSPQQSHCSGNCWNNSDNMSIPHLSPFKGVYMIILRNITHIFINPNISPTLETDQKSKSVGSVLITFYLCS